MTLLVARHGRRLLIVSATMLVGGAISALAQQQPQAPPSAPATKVTPMTKAAPAAGGAETPAVDKNAGSYALGVLYGVNLRGNGFTADRLNNQNLLQGMRDAMTGKARLKPSDQQTLNSFGKANFDHGVEVNHAAADAFLAQNGKKPGVTTTASGLEYKVLTAGKGDSPKATDMVSVNYRGTTLDGGEFDSNMGMPPVELGVNHVIPGWTEALQLMKPGDKWQVWIPPKLAYDTRLRPPIPPGSMLIFDMELVSFKPAPPSPAPPAIPPAPPAPMPPKN